MSTTSFPDLGVGVLASKFRLLLPFSMTPHHTPVSSPTMPSSSRSEKLLRDALLRDERERQHLFSPPGPTAPPTHKRRHSYVPTSSYSASTSISREDYTRGSFLFRPAMSNPRSPSPSSFSQGREMERDAEDAHIKRTLFDDGDVEGINGFQRRHSHGHRYQQQQQQSKTSYRSSSLSPSSRQSRRSSSPSPSPSPLHMRRRQEGLGPTSSNTHTMAPTSTPSSNDPNIPRNQSLHNTNTTHYCHSSAYPSPSHGRGEPTPHEQAVRARLESALIVSGSDVDSSRIRMRRRDENEVRDEQGGCPLRRGRQGTGDNGVGLMMSGSVMTTSSSGSNSNSSYSQLASPSNYLYTAHTHTYTHTHYPVTPNRTTVNNNRSPHYSPHTPYSAPVGVAASTGYTSLPSQTCTQSQTNLHHHSPPNPIPHSLHSPRRNNSTPTTTSLLPAALTHSGSNKLTRSHSKPRLLSDPEVGEPEELRLPTPPPTPPLIARSAGGYVPSPYKIANPSPSGTPTRTVARTQNQTKKEGGLEMRRPTQGPAAAYKDKGKEQDPLRPLDFYSLSSQQRRRDVTITQQSQKALQLSTSPNPLQYPKKSNNNADTRSLASTESCSTSGSSISHLDGCASGYCGCSSHSYLDGHVNVRAPPPPAFSVVHGSILPYSQASPSSVSPTTKPFNARKASTQCRAIQGYVSFANVEGLGEPPLVGDEFEDGSSADGDRGKGKAGKGTGPLGVWNAAFGWKRFLGGTGHGIEGLGRGVVV